MNEHQKPLATIEEMLPYLRRMAGCMWRPGIACLDYDDLLSNMVVGASEALQHVPAGCNPTAYLIGAGRIAAIVALKAVKQESALSLEKDLGEGLTLADLLATPERPTADSGEISEQTAKLLAACAPQYQQAIQERWHFTNWEPAPSQSRSPVTYGDALVGVRLKHKIKGPGRRTTNTRQPVA